MEDVFIHIYTAQLARTRICIFSHYKIYGRTFVSYQLCDIGLIVLINKLGLPKKKKNFHFVFFFIHTVYVLAKKNHFKLYSFLAIELPSINPSLDDGE